MAAESPVFEQVSIIDLIRYGGSRFNEAGLTFGHSYDNALDEATQLVLHALHLPHDLSPVYGRLACDRAEKAKVLALFDRRVNERVPAAYLTGEAWFAGLSFKSDRRALVPRSPIAELIIAGFEPWLGGRDVERVLDLCTGSGCIAIATGHYHPNWQVDGADINDDALSLAAENKERLHADNVRLRKSDLFNGLQGRGLRPDRHQSALRHQRRDRCAAEGVFLRAGTGPARRRRRPRPGAEDPARRAGAPERTRPADLRSRRGRKGAGRNCCRNCRWRGWSSRSGRWASSWSSAQDLVEHHARIRQLADARG